MKANNEIKTDNGSITACEKEKRASCYSHITINPPPDVSAEDIKALRQSLKMTQKTFAAIMGVTNKAVEAWENGTNTPGGTARRMIGILLADSSIPEKYNIIAEE